MNNKIILLGGNPLNAGMLNVASRMGAALQVVDWNESVDWLPGRHIKDDIKAAELSEILSVDDLLFCYSSADIAAFNVLEINKKAGFYVPTAEQISNCIYKDKLYDCFNAKNLLGREYIILHQSDFDNQENTLQVLRDYISVNEKIVLKPNNSSSSRGVKFYENAAPEYIYADALETITTFKGNILIDRYVNGTEYSVEMIADHQGNVSAWPIGLKCKSIHGTSDAISVKVIYNPVLNEKIKQEITDFSIACAKASGVKASLLHLELKVDESGQLFPIEMACRSSGFVGSHLVDYVSEESYFGTYAKVLRGVLLKDGAISEVDVTSVYFFYDYPEGRVISPTEMVSGTVFAEAGFTTHFMNVKHFTEGQILDQHENDTTKVMYRVLTAPRQKNIQQKIEAAEKEIYSKGVNIAHV